MIIKETLGKRRKKKKVTYAYKIDDFFCIFINICPVFCWKAIVNVFAYLNCDDVIAL